MLTDIGWRDHPDYRAEQAFTRVLRLPVAGIDHKGRVALALAMAIRYGADLDETHYADPFMSLVKDDDVTFAWRVGAVIRLAYSLSGGNVPDVEPDPALQEGQQRSACTCRKSPASCSAKPCNAVSTPSAARSTRPCRSFEAMAPQDALTG